MKFKYSFIIPHRNSPALLSRLIESIPQRKDIEIIIVDDNSSIDKRPSIIRGDLKIIELEEQDSNGAGHARNIGLDMAQGEWLLFADADDFYEPGFIDVLDKYIDSSADIVYFDVFNYNESIGMSRTLEIERYNKSSHTEKDKNRMAFSSNEPWNKMFKRNFILKNNIRFEEIPLGNDAWFVINAGYCAKKIDVISQKLYHYIDNATGITKKKRPLEHHYIAVRSLIRRNKIFWLAGLPELIPLRIEKYKIVPSYGWGAYLKLMYYYYSHDRKLIPCLIKKIGARFFFI